jgi:hypothetical protein
MIAARPQGGAGERRPVPAAPRPQGGLDAITAPSPLTVISYGGGVQSTAMCVLATQGVLGYDIDAALYSNVGDDSEHPDTNRYVREVMIPWAAERGLPVHELNRRTRDGNIETLYGRLMKEGSRSLPIPIRMSNGAPGTRSCTKDFKIAVVGKWLKANGASKDNPATVCIGISTDEIKRIGNKRAEPYEIPTYPLIDLGFSRADCLEVIRKAGLPQPRKSACYFCPFHRPQAWAEMRRDEPELFAKSQHLEATLNERRDMLGKDHVWLTRFNKPLGDAVAEAQTPLFTDGEFGDGACDEGYCWT